MLPDLAPGRVGEQRAQYVQHHFARQLRGAPDSRGRAGWQQAAPGSTHRLMPTRLARIASARRFGVEGELAGIAQASPPTRRAGPAPAPSRSGRVPTARDRCAVAAAVGAATEATATRHAGVPADRRLQARAAVQLLQRLVEAVTRVQRAQASTSRSRRCRSAGPSCSATSVGWWSTRVQRQPRQRSRRASPILPPMASAWAITPSSEPYSASHFAAVFGPHFGHARDVVDAVAHQRRGSRRSGRRARRTSTTAASESSRPPLMVLTSDHPGAPAAPCPCRRGDR